MNYWSSARWKIAISDGESQQWIEPKLPFALIGSHDCCSGRITSKRTPNVVYLACCFTDSIEVWPVCPIAFARWGIVDPEHELLAGQQRISLIHQTHPNWDQVASSDSGPYPGGVSTPARRSTVGGDALLRESPPDLTAQITLDWDGKLRPRRLFRRVTIVGDDHPSTLRLHGQELMRCDHAIIGDGESAWLINLHPEPGMAAEDLVVPLDREAEPIMIGSVKVRLGQAGAPQRPVRQQRTRVRQPKIDTTSRSSRRVSSRGESTPEDLTSKVTDRLMSIDQANFNRKRIIKLSLYVAGFAIAAALLAWIVIMQVLPLIPDAE